MTIEEANTFLNNLKACIEEHPIVADWLVEIADRKTEPQTSCKTCHYGEVDEGYVRCAYYSKSTEQDEPQTPYDNCKLCKFWFGYCHLEECGFAPIEDEPQTERRE